MAIDSHITERLSAWLDGRLPAAQAAEVEQHLAGCKQCVDERDLLREGKALFGAALEAEPRPGFATRVALHAADARRPAAPRAWRWAFGGLAGAAVAAGVLLTVVPKVPVDAPRSDELMLAQRLDLYEDLSLMQNREALENLEVVEQLDQLAPEAGRP